ncbi:MAG: gamma-glutamyl-gamma-aminobutyrate hydrolase family protein [Bacteroidota bacterium]
MTIHYLQHVPFEGLSHIQTWGTERGVIFTGTHLFSQDSFPEVDAIDGLIILGGPMGVYQEKEYPWMETEKEFIRAIIHAGKPVLGICLGAQLIAAVLGGEVYPHARKEIGWYPIEPASSTTLLPIPCGTTVLHWHGDTFDLPEHARLLARSEACEHQAFMVEEHVLGIQFHLEVDEHQLNEMIEHEHLIKDIWVMEEDELLQGLSAHASANRKILDEMLDQFFVPSFRSAHE